MSHSKNVIAVNEKSFDAEVLKSDKPVLVDFTATWCGPCKALAPVMDKLADDAAGRYKVVAVDIDESPSIATKYGIRGVPTVMAFKNGAQSGQHVGVTNRETLLKLVGG